MKNEPSHITRGDVLDDLGFSRSEATAMKVKADLLDAILQVVRKNGYSQRQLTEILGEYQPSISNLLQGKIAQVSIEKLLQYSDRLSLRACLTVRSSSRAGVRKPVVTVQSKRQSAISLSR